MATGVGVKKVGARTATAGLVIAGISALLLFAVTVSGGKASVGLIALVITGLVIAAVGFARRVLSALENR